MRHGDSIPAGNDDERPLSEQGIKDVKKLANFIAPYHLKIARILQSNKYRAQQTASLLLSGFTNPPSIESRAELDPMARVQLMVPEINSWSEDSLLVGHMPYMSKLAAELLLGDENKEIIVFKTATMVCLESTEHFWTIRWMLTPEL